MIPTHTRLAAAQAYAQRGWRVFPLHSVRSGDCSCGSDACKSKGKHPRTKHGMKDATTDADQIRQWWAALPDANIGIATGNGLYVIDIDTAKGASVTGTEDGKNDFSELLETSLSVRTGSGGYHIYLSYDPALKLSNTASKLGPFIDTRGEGGYVVAPPSNNAQGVYSWLGGEKEILPIPANLLSVLRVGKAAGHMQRQEKQHGQIPTDAQILAAQAFAAPSANLQAAAADRATQSQVSREARNVFLTSAAGKLCRLFDLDQPTVEAALLAINEARWGEGKHEQGSLPQREVEGIFKSIPLWLPSTSGLGLASPRIEMVHDVMSRPVPATRWIVNGLLPEGLCLFAGKPKAGKSWLALALQLGCALGSEVGGLVLGRYPVDALGVLYLSLEDTEARFHDRVKKLLGGRPVPRNFARALDWKPLLAGGLFDLEAHLACHPQTRLVVIDTLARVRTASAGNYSMYQEDSDLMGQLQNLAKEHHIALVLVHHLRKMSSNDVFDEISGSTGLTGVADTSFVLKRERNQNGGVLSVTGREVEEQEIAMEFAPATGHWTCNGKAAEREVSQGKQDILDLLKEKGAMTPSEIAQVLEKPRNAVNTYLGRMVQERLIDKIGRGRYELKVAEEHPEPTWEELDLGE